MYVCTWPVCLVPAYGGQRVSDPLELGHVHAGKQSVSFGRTSHRCSQQLSSSPRTNSFSLFKDLFFCIVSVLLV